MNWDMIITITNSYVLLMWLVLALAPRREAMLTGLFYGGIGLLACTYSVIRAHAWTIAAGFLSAFAFYAAQQGCRYRYARIKQWS